MTLNPVEGGNNWTYTWNAENRLMKAVNDDKELNFKYDLYGRRIRKTVKNISGTTEKDITFLYDGWNMIVEVDVMKSVNQSSYYLWGLDLSGTRHAAGGVGGLLAVEQDGDSFFPVYDANGNIFEYLEKSSTGSSDLIRAHYEYDLFGGVTCFDEDVSFALQFSTKYYDELTGLSCYGTRYYSASLGKWLRRDTIGEHGGINTYGFVNNSTLNYWDYLGREPFCYYGWPMIEYPPPSPPVVYPEPGEKVEFRDVEFHDNASELIQKAQENSIGCCTEEKRKEGFEKLKQIYLIERIKMKSEGWPIGGAPSERGRGLQSCNNQAQRIFDAIDTAGSFPCWSCNLMSRNLPYHANIKGKNRRWPTMYGINACDHTVVICSGADKDGTWKEERMFDTWADREPGEDPEVWYKKEYPRLKRPFERKRPGPCGGRGEPLPPLDPVAWAKRKQNM